MPVLAPPEDGIKLRNVYTRLNPSGDQETVRKRPGKPDEATLSELDQLADRLSGLLEGSGGVEFAGLPALSAEQPNSQRVVNQPSPPQLVASRGDPARAQDETLTNMTVAPQTSDLGLGLGPTPADGPELGRMKVRSGASPKGNDIPGKLNIGYTGDNIDYGATHSEHRLRSIYATSKPITDADTYLESFTGTGNIAFAPGALTPSPPRKRRRNKDKDTVTQEHTMSTRRTINEWLPGFKSAGYDPGDHQMPSPSGKGVAERGTTENSVGSYDTETSHDGKEWPRDHNDTAAMCDVDEDGTEHEPQGSHESSHAEASDGHQDKVGHNWPDQPKNSGQGVAEPFGGSRWSDGGVLKGDRGPGADTWTHEEGPGMAGTGPITGTSGPQLGHPTSEDWSPDNMARLMGDDFNVKALFDSYARTARAVCLEDFQQLCEAHGADIVLDQTSIMQLMDSNQEFMFYEGADANGPYWVPTPLSECDDSPPAPKKKTPPKKKAVGEGEQRRPFTNKGQPITEMQIRSPEDEAGLYGDAADMQTRDDLYGGDPALGAGMPGIAEPSLHHGDGYPSAYDDRLRGAGGLGDELGGGQMECPGCGYTGEEEACPECGIEMVDVGGEAGLTDPAGGEFPPDFDGAVERGEPGLSDAHTPREMSTVPRPRPFESRIVNGPKIVESLKNFMTSAHSLIERNTKARPRDLAEALNHSWAFHAGRVDANTCPTKVQNTLRGLMQRYPGFNPVVENEAMNRPEGTKLGGGDGPKENLPAQPSEMKTNGDKSLLGRHQTNNLEGTPTIPGTGKKLTGRSVNEGMVPPAAPAPAGAAGAAPRPPVAPAGAAPAPAAPVRPGVPPPAPGVATQAVQENINRLARYVKSAIKEGAKALRGKYNLQFSVLVTEGKLPAFLKDKEKGKDGKPAKKDGKGKDGKGKDGKPAFLKKKNRTPPRDNLAEALADAEEILQLHQPEDVTFEATFLGPLGQVALKQDIPLFTIMPRGPMVGEGRALFRFQRHAEAFADKLVAEGVTCRIYPHNWGSAVEAKTDYRMAAQAFSMISEKKDWIQGAVNPEHKGYCTPMTKDTCTPARKALAKRFKSGDLHHGGKKKDD